MEHSHLRERAVDVRDLGTRVLGYLQDADRQGRVDYPEATVLVAEELTASAPWERASSGSSWSALCRCGGSANSHTAILARAMGIRQWSVLRICL